MDRETDRLLAAARDQQREEPRATGEEPQSGVGEAEPAPLVDLGDGGAPIRRDSFERAWRVKGGDWRREPSGRELMFSVIHYLAAIDMRGRERFYREAVNRLGEPLFPDAERESRKWRRVEPDIDRVVNIHRSHQSIGAFLAQACTQCRTSTGVPIHLGEDIELVLDLSSG